MKNPKKPLKAAHQKEVGEREHMIKLKALLLTQLREKKNCLKRGRKRLLLTQLRKLAGKKDYLKDRRKRLLLKQLRKLVGRKDCLKEGRKRLRVKIQQN